MVCAPGSVALLGEGMVGSLPALVGVAALRQAHRSGREGKLDCSDELCTSRIKQTGVVFMTLATAIFFLPSPYIKLDTHKDILQDKDKKKFLSISPPYSSY